MIGPLEVAANSITAISIVLAGRNNIHTWWTGITGCSLFAVVFFEADLYADVLLQAFFIAASFLGWRQWHHGARGSTLPVSNADLSKMVAAIIGGVAMTAVYGALLRYNTNAYAPFADSAVLVFSVIAQLLLMQRRVENWPFWVLVNTIAVPLYASRGLYLTAVLYGFYWVNAIVSWHRWRRLAPVGSLTP